MRCPHCGTSCSDDSAFCLNCGLKLPPRRRDIFRRSLERLRLVTAIRRRAPHIKRINLVRIGVGLLLIAALAAAGWFAYVRSRPTFQPRIVVVRSEAGRFTLEAIDLTGRAVQLDQLSQVPGDSTMRLSESDGDVASTSVAAGVFAHLWPDGRLALVGMHEGGGWTLLRFDLTRGEPLEYTSELQDLQVFTDRNSPRFVFQWQDVRGKSLAIGDVTTGRLNLLVEGADQLSGGPGANWQHVAYAVRNAITETQYLARMDGGEVKATFVLPRLRDTQSTADITDDGSRILYVAGGTLYRRNMEGGQPQQLTPDGLKKVNLLSVNSRTGQMLLTAAAGDRIDLYLSDANGARIGLVRGALAVNDAAFSPDGSWLYARVRENDGDSLHLFDADSGARRTIYHGSRGGTTRWLADGRLLYVVYGSDNLGSLRLLEANTDMSRSLADGFAELTQLAYDPAGYLAYVTVSQGKSSLFIVTLRDRVPFQIEEGQGRIDYIGLASQGTVVYQTARKDGLKILAADEGAPVPRVVAENASIVASNLYR